MRLVVIPLALGLLGPPIVAGHEPPAEPFDVSELFLELNHTDGDLGLHANLDGGGWTTLEIEGPRDRPLLGILTTGALRRQALTQLSFESTEPDFDEVDPAVFFRRFPEGRYEIEGRRQGGGAYESVVWLSHVLAAPVVSTVSGFPAAEDCDAEPLPEVQAPVTIDWDPVTTSHPDIGTAGPVQIIRYQFFLEQDATRLSLDLPPTVTEFEIPPALTAAKGVFKFEIIARTTTGNNTAVESCFRVW